FNARSGPALAQLVNEHGVQLRQFPDDVLKLFRELSRQIVDEKARGDPMFRKVLDSFTRFERDIAPWTRIADQAFVNARSL
ncbi:MAG: hypothetical protein NZM12_00400, partial [Steroidobacteraceae bacterium]|nr:hypothetical protein [Steroidobacteraceae bacterium]MDW8258248.1 ABC transporter substrate-binding protein [Gammaproteobacteria bacterium]